MLRKQILSKEQLRNIKDNLIQNRKNFKQDKNTGDFSFLPVSLCNNKNFIEQNSDFFNAVEKTPGGWEFLRKENPPNHLGYTRWRHPILDKIETNVKNINCYRDITIACYIRNMKEIAINGWGYWVDKQIDYYIDIINKELNSNN